MKIKLERKLTSKEENWLQEAVGPRMYYLHIGQGGVGWHIKRDFEGSLGGYVLNIDDDKLATFFIIKFL